MKKCAKFLGLIFDSHLTWNEHINYIIDRSRKRLNSNWGGGASGPLLLRVYKALIRLTLEYGVEAFDSASMAVKDKLTSIQYQAFKICVGAVSRTSLEKLQVKCGVPPSSLRRT